MGIPEQGASVYDWSQPRETRPLRDFRPPLRSDPRSLIEKAAQLSLEDNSIDAAAFSSVRNIPQSKRLYSSLSSSLNRQSAKAQDRLQQKVFQSRISSNKYNFRLIKDNDVSDATIEELESISVSSGGDTESYSDFYGLKEVDLRSDSSAYINTCSGHKKKTVRFSPDQQIQQDFKFPILSSDISPHQSKESLKSFKPCLRGREHGDGQRFQNGENCKKLPQYTRQAEAVHPTKKYSRLSAKDFKSHKNLQNGGSSPDYDSGIDSVKDPSSPMCSTPLPSEDALCRRSTHEARRALTYKVAGDTSQCVNRTCLSQSCDSIPLDSETSFDESSISTIDDDIPCVNPPGFVSHSMLFLHEPVHRETSVEKMNESSSQSEDKFSVSIGSREEFILTPPKNDVAFQRKESVRFDYETSKQNENNEIIASWKVSLSATQKTEGEKVCGQFEKEVESFSSNSETSLQSDDVSQMVALGLPVSFQGSAGVKRKAFDSPVEVSNLRDLTEACFSKKYYFKPAAWELPEPGAMFSSAPWKIGNFQILKRKLNEVKDELNDMSLQDWHSHTRRRNKAGNVLWQVRNKINPEFPTQAWCKLYENLSDFPLVPQKAVKEGYLKSIHLCEAPGAFITSLNHFLRVNFGPDFIWDWRANTLNPYYEGNPLSCMINDDRLILNTLDKWLFGKDETGDLMSQENLVHIIDKASELGEVLLITADGSFDCQDNPGEQEDIVSWLHYCETVAALHMLAAGGSLLIKMFTFYEHVSICILYLLNCVFKSVTVNKPVTSKEGNSEVYVICCDYKGASTLEPWLTVLKEHYGPKAPEKAIFSTEDLPSSFMDQVYLCADFFRQKQTSVIRENIRSYHYPQKKDNSVIAAVRHRVCNEFFSRFNIKKIDRSLYLVDKNNLKNILTLNVDPRIEEGSYNDRRKRLELSPEEELQCIEDDLLHLKVEWPGHFDVFWIEFSEKPKGLKITRGKPVNKVNSSKFCLGRLLKLRNRVRQLASQAEVTAETSSDTRVLTWPDGDVEPTKGKVFRLDFETKLWSSLEDGSNSRNEKNACREILKTVDNLFRDDCLELRGFPLLTQFNVGVVFLLGHLFQKVGFVRPLGQDIRILFYKYRKFNPEMECHWAEVVSIIEEDCESVLSCVQIGELSDGDFYRYVTEINNLCVREQIHHLLRSMRTENSAV